MTPLEYLITDTLNNKVASDSLKLSIEKEPGITIQVNSVTYDDAKIYIGFAAALPGTQRVDFLDPLVAAHAGVQITNKSIVGLQVKTPAGVDKLAVTKPDGISKTHISHNFCDSDTWSNVNDSSWMLIPPVDKDWKVLKAEVQFSHDIQLSTHVPPLNLKLDFIVDGQVVPSESKEFKSLSDVFDLGNKHYTMSESVDGMPGITTVVFDYADAISLIGSQGGCMKLYVEDDTPLGGSYCSISFAVEPLDKV